MSPNPTAVSEFLTGSSEVAVSAHAQYKFAPKHPQTTGATTGGLQVAVHRNCHFFLLIIFRQRDGGAAPVRGISVVWLG